VDLEHNNVAVTAVCQEIPEHTLRKQYACRHVDTSVAAWAIAAVIAVLCVSVAAAVPHQSAGIPDNLPATAVFALWADVVVGRFAIQVVMAIIVAFYVVCLLPANPAGSQEWAVVWSVTIQSVRQLEPAVPQKV
jgi:hypothetical protein